MHLINRYWIILLTSFMFINTFSLIEAKTVQFHGLRPYDPWGNVGYPNPERGFRYESRIGEDQNSTKRLFAPSRSVASHVPPSAVFTDYQWILGMERWRPFGVSVMQAYCYLTEFNDKPISKHKLNLIRQSLQRVRECGYKVILRFAYEKDLSAHSGAKPEIMLTHIQQLRPILNEYADVIFAMYAGFFGAWGEWHSDKYTDNHDFVTRGEIVKALCDATPSDCPVLMRTPQALLGVLKSPYFNKQLQKYEHRFGLHNDAFLAEDMIGGAFSPKAKGENHPLYDFVLSSSAKMLVEGELFWSNLIQLPHKQAKSDFPNDGLIAAVRLRNQHYTCLSLAHCYSDYEGKPYAIDKWMINKISAKDLKKLKLPFDPEYFKDPFGKMTTRTQFEYIRDHLGYNLKLLSASFPTSAVLGSVINISANLKNYGFSAPIRKRSVYFCLIDLDCNVYPFKITNADPRHWQPYMPSDRNFVLLTHKINAQIKLPTNLKPGWHHLGIWLPDIHKPIHFDSRYAIRFMNRDTNWWTTTKGEYGINLIGMILLKK